VSVSTTEAPSPRRYHGRFWRYSISDMEFVFFLCFTCLLFNFIVLASVALVFRLYVSIIEFKSRTAFQ
jgi:hypothetical protein